MLLSFRYRSLFWACLGSSALLSACSNSNYNNTATFLNDTTINAVIEIPAGTSKKIEFYPATGTFKTDQRNGQDRIIRFLPYPANYGFVPGTLSSSEAGGDGDALDMLVISEALATGTVIPVVPIGILRLTDDGEEDFKIVAVPADHRLNHLGAYRAEDIRNIEQIRQIITEWFLHYDTDPATATGWGNREEALQYIRNNTRQH